MLLCTTLRNTLKLIISLTCYDKCNFAVVHKLRKSRQIANFYNYPRTSLDLCKIDKNNQTLLELRSRSVNEQNKLQDAGGEDVGSESDITTVAEKSLDNDDETTLRGEEF